LPPGVPLAKLGDFGLAWLTTAADERTRLTSTNITLGSPHYMAPEQLTGDTVDWRADIYSLGATAYHLLSGLPPMSGVDMTRLMAMKLQGKSESLRITRPDITPTSADLVDELMTADPKKRPQDYGVLIDRIDDLIGQQGLSSSRRMLASTQLSAIRPPAPVDPNAVTQQAPRESTISNHTIEIPDEPPSSRRSWILVIATILLAIIAVAAIAIPWLNSPGKPDLVTHGTRMTLSYADGQYQDWKKIEGHWVDSKNGDKESVLAGAKGVIARDFSDLATDANNQLRNYQLQVFAELNKAEAVEVHVGFPARDQSPAPSDQRRVVLRLTRQGAELGHKLSDEHGWHPSSRIPFASTKGPDGKHSLILERHTTGWRALLDGAVVGFVNAPPRPEAHEFRLLAAGGEAWFSDIEIMEMRQPEPK
jgi:hypothetical protein